MLLLLIICIGVVNAEQITMDVNSKHIIGMGTGYIPLTLDDSNNFCNIIYIVSEMKDGYVVQEYPVSIQDYYKIQVGQKITLEPPIDKTQPCKVIKIES